MDVREPRQNEMFCSESICIALDWHRALAVHGIARNESGALGQRGQTDAEVMPACMPNHV